MKISQLLAAGLLAVAVVSLPADAQRFARDVSDQSAASSARQRGDLKPLDQLLPAAQAAGRGEYLGVDFDQDSNTYRFKFMRPNGSVVAVDMDGRTGRVLRTQ
ncbi:PepSY domain-containing protein [Sandaracinobacteroides saxicola]|uniref:PepSY domain-containing protein n=1 Tax=Sandaracinobacteroides saxicola TaxID=2759707 RepID=UPI001FB12C0D|nr:hypothetical protein [Sandaracinobacteroides saxicola]